ncbi:MAG: 4-hydroxy-3-methylbut-2-enyl diphosphate reductase [Gemmatimonadetes bacterium]|nr:4-hydroxy-3-methylbut-2-enyl diphosphate reductase [Gemmatimonadota bacterium]MCC7133827.1 4-hydroxy-3-methylbut-2-enyl diphosphate reductase [Gemmatimonadales bacterium]
MTDSTYFRKGFGLKGAIEGVLAADYHSALIEAFKTGGYRLTAGPLEFRLAREFGFCYGVDRAVEYAYETRAKFPDRSLVLVGEIIHNPHVNHKLESMGIQFLHRDAAGTFDFSSLTADHVVILPAFGVTIQDFTTLRAIGCVLVDTTCGSVLNVWKRVESYARDGYTAVIHGKHWHEETKATASQVTKFPQGRYLVVLNMEEAREVCRFILEGTDLAAIQRRFGPAASEHFDFERDLLRVGIANQTTMLSRESLAIAEEFRQTMIARWGSEHEAEHVRTFDTICSATQERQDAVVQLLEEPLDVMLVVGGYNSSNTCHLAALCERRGVTTYHIEDADCIDPAAGTIRHQPVGAKKETTRSDWLGSSRRIGLTAGASTPNNKIGETVVRVAATAGIDPATLVR